MGSKMANAGTSVSLSLAFCMFLACRREGPAQVRQISSFPGGSRHAVELFQHGHATVGTRVYVAIIRGQAPQVGDTLLVEDLCYVFTAYRTGPWKMTWEGDSRIDLAIDGPIRKDYERMIEQESCDGITSRWYYEDPPRAP